MTARRYKPYPSYKDSGVEWLGEVPAGWEVLSLKRVASIKYGLGEPPQLLADGLPFVRATNVTRGRIVDRDFQFVDPNDVPWNREPVLRARDIIVVRSGAYTGDSAIIPAQYDGAIAGYDMVVRERKCQSEFLAWTLLSRYVLEAQIELASLRAAQPHLNAEELGSVVLLRPSDSEQRAIAAFLDRETARIDALVAKKERLIALLQEQRTALIARAVTKGLDPTVPMKDSGVEWLGEIPAHWRVFALKRIGDLQAGAGFPDDEQGIQDEETPFFKVGDMGAPSNEREMLVHQHSVSRATARRLRAHVFPAGTIVFAKVGAALLLNRRRLIARPSCIDNNMMGFMPDDCDTTWALYWLTGLDMGRLANPGAVPSVNEGQMRGTPAAVPPLPEQRAIAAFLDRETARIDALVAKIRDAIDRLRELRTALISAAVTGKIDAREEVA